MCWILRYCISPIYKTLRAHRFFIPFLYSLNIYVFGAFIFGISSFLLGYWLDELEFNGRYPQQWKETLLLVGILSSPNNFEYRNSIRETWLNSANVKFQYHFVIGKKLCDIPLEDRTSHHGCSWQNISLPVDVTEETEFVTNYAHNEIAVGNDQKVVVGFHFIVHHPIVVRKLNVIRAVVHEYREVSISLINSFTGEVIVTSEFTETFNEHEYVISKPIEPYVLPKDFEGQIVMIVKNSTKPTSCFKKWGTELGFLNFLYLVPFNSIVPITFHDDFCTPVSLTFGLQDVQGLLSYLSLREKRIQSWNKHVTHINDKLIQENDEYNDIVFVDVVDVYTNLPLKVLEFFKWSTNVVNFNFLLKTDDDTFVNIKSVADNLQETKSLCLNRRFWWSSFRTGWSVQTTGKWRENFYKSVTYPPFPCGAGYVLSHDIVEYLAHNSDYLKYFQGEDVSIGIWLAGLNISVVDDEEKWECSENCNPESYIHTQLTVDEMYQTYNAYTKCNTLCNNRCNV